MSHQSEQPSRGSTGTRGWWRGYGRSEIRARPLYGPENAGVGLWRRLPYPHRPLLAWEGHPSAPAGLNVVAIWRLNANGIFAIIALAALRAGDLLPVSLEIDG